MLVVDLLIAGLKKAVTFLAGFKGEASELTKANRNLEMSLAGVNEMMSEQALEGKTAGEALIIQANATAGLIDAMETQSKQQAAATKEAGTFGKILINLGNFFEAMGMKMQAFFRPITFGFQQMGKTIEILRIQSQHDFAFISNGLARLNNLLADEDGQIALITEEDKAAMLKRIEELKTEYNNTKKAQDNLFTAATINLLGSTVAASAEFQSLNAIIAAGGPALNELTEFMGTGNINTFAEDIDSVKTALAVSGDEAKSTQDILAGNFTPAVAALAENFVKVDENGKRTIDVIGLLGATLTQGTATTVDAGKAAEELGETFKNSGEKINKFFTGLKEKSSLGPMLTEFKNFETLTKSIREGEGGDVAFLEQFEKAPASLKTYLTNTKEIISDQERLNKLKSQELTNDLQRALVPKLIERLEKRIADAIGCLLYTSPSPRD